MRSTISTLLSFVLASCGGSSNHNDHTIDAPADTADAPVTTTLTVTNYRFTGPVNTQLVAVQDGDGPWTEISGNAGVYTTSLHGDRFGIVLGCVTTAYSTVFAIYGAVSDGTSWFVDDCGDTGAAAATISGTISGAAAANPVRIVNGFDALDLPAGTTTYSFPTSAGPTRLFAEELVGDRPVKLAMVDTTVVDGATINFDLGSGFAPVTHAVTANRTIAAASLTYRDVQTFARLDSGAAPFADYRAVPANQLGNGLDRLEVAAVGTNSAAQYVIRYFKTPADETVTLPPVLQLAQPPTATAGTAPTVAATFPVQAGVTYYDVDVSTTNQTTMMTHDWYAEWTAGYVAKKYPGGTISYAMPDLHGLPDFQAVLQLEAGQTIDWTVEDNTNTNVDLFNAVPPDQFAFHDGGEEAFTSAYGQLAAP